MSKKYFVEGIVLFLIGLGCLAAALLTETSVEAILWGLTGGFLVQGVGLCARYLYWTAPKHSERYQELREQEEINLHDERNERLRDMAGRVVYIISIMVVCFSMLGFAIFGSMGMVEGYKVMILYLGIFLVFQVVLGVVIFNWLKKRY